MRSIRVLHITPSVRLLGARRSLLTLARSFAGTRVEPIVLAPAEGPLTEELDKRHLRWIRLRLPPWRKGIYWPLVPLRLAALKTICRAEKIDLIHCNEFHSNPHAVIAGASGSTMVQTVSRTLHGHLLPPLDVPVVTHMRLSVTPRMIRNYYLEDATRIIAVSQGASAGFDHCWWKSRKVRVAYNGIDLDEFEEARRGRRLMRARLGFGDDDFVVGQIGLLMPRKRPRFLIDAAPAILQRSPNVRFLLVGEASPGQERYLDELKSLAQETGVAHAVRFLPFQRHIAEIFAAIDLNVLLSNDEGFGRVVIEAAGAGVPTIGSNTGGIPELIVHGRTGCLIGGRNAGDAEFARELPRFAEIVSELARDRELSRLLGAAANERAHDLFSAERCVRDVLRVFEEALDVFDRNRLPW